MSDKACKNNPFLPHWCSIPGQGPYVLKSPNNIESAIHFLRSLPTTPRLRMVRRCKKCHRFTTGAPHPDLDHATSGTGAACTLPHHPTPCDWADEKGEVCQHYLTDNSHEEAGNSVFDLRQQIEQLQREKEEEIRMRNLAEQAGQRLRETH